MTALASLFRHVNPDVSTVVAGTTLTSQRRVGIELELENIVHSHRSQWWDFKNDDSLRNNGREFVLKQPLGGVDAEKAIRALPGILRNESPELSERTSTHIHVDVRDLTIEQLRNVVVLFAACESYIYTLGGKHRYNNIYCPGFTASQSLVDQAIKLYTCPDDEFTYHIGEWTKYSGINLCAVSSFGSVEFRMFQGFKSAHVLMGWVKCVTKLVDFASSITSEDLRKIIADDPIGAVFGDHTIDDQIVRRNKQNALAIVHCKELRAIRARAPEGAAQEDNSGSVPTSDRDRVLEQLRALAL